MDRLYSKEQIEEWASKRADDAGRLSRQLLDTMRENERLRKFINLLQRAKPQNGEVFIEHWCTLPDCERCNKDSEACDHGWEGEKRGNMLVNIHCRDCGEKHPDEPTQNAEKK